MTEPRTFAISSKMSCRLDRRHERPATAGLLFAALLTALALTLVSTAGAADEMRQADPSGDLPLLGDKNEIDNPNQIDRPDELEAAGKEPHTLSADELSKELSNPNSPLASLVFKQTYTSYKGDLPGAGDQSSNLTLFQPVFPFPLTEDGTTNLFIRPAIPYLWEQPVFDTKANRFKSVSGFGDMGFDVGVGRSYDSGWVMVGGIQGTLPTGADRLSADQYRLGPEFLVAKLGEKGYWAVFPAHQWDVSGGDTGYSTSQLELFAGLYLPNAWTVYTDSKWGYDWENDQPTIPLNLSVRKVTKLGELPIQFNLGIDYFVESNDAFGQDWAVSLSVSPVVPNFIYNAFHK